MGGCGATTGGVTGAVTTGCCATGGSGLRGALPQAASNRVMNISRTERMGRYQVVGGANSLLRCSAPLRQSHHQSRGMYR